MDKNLIIVWALGVVAFFVLWALLAKLIKRISEKRQKDATTFEKNDEKLTFPKQ